MKWITLFLASLLPFFGKAQNSSDGLDRTEHMFASISVARGAKAAFLQFLDSADGIAFDKGKPVSAYAYWKARPVQPGLLNWLPNLAGAHGDFGYTTGPWTYSAPNSDTVNARGQFITVWHWVNGHWKFLIDLGVSSKGVESLSYPDPVPPPIFSAGADTASLLLAENDFNKTFTTSPAMAYAKYLSPGGVLNRNGDQSAHGRAGRDRLIAATSAAIELQTLGHHIGSGADYAFTYGRATLSGKADNYLRIWRYEVNQWKIFIDVLRF